jgi:hypothetical protein
MNDIAINPFSAAPAAPAVGGGALVEAESARAVAEVQAALVIAKRFPRNVVAAMDRVLNACARQKLAEGAVYAYSRGGSDISGPSIRLAEAIAQHWGNIQFGYRELSRSTDVSGVPVSEVEAYAWDVEANTRRSINFRVRHWRDTKGGGYKVKDERDSYEVVSNQAQRRVRACILGVIPGDVVEEAVRACEITLKTSAEVTPESTKAMLEKFSAFGVSSEQIEARIQRRLDAMLPAQLVSLRRIYNSLRDGISQPAEWFQPATDAAESGAPTPPTTAAGVEGLKARMAVKKKSAAAAAAAAAATGWPSAAGISEAIGTASTPEALDDAASLIGDMPEPERASLRAQYESRRAEMAA